jgi:coenzyme Q-binding protein COQ10
MKSKLVEKNVTYNARSMFELVSDVEEYPLFVPACKSLKIINKYEKEEITHIDATMKVGYGILNEFFTSHISINSNNLTIDVVNKDGPFIKLNNYWKFKDEKHGCKIKFNIEFEAKQSLTGSIINLMFEKVFLKYMDAFEKRAHKIFK